MIRYFFIFLCLSMTIAGYCQVLTNDTSINKIGRYMISLKPTSADINNRIIFDSINNLEYPILGKLMSRTSKIGNYYLTDSTMLLVVEGFRKVWPGDQMSLIVLKLDQNDITLKILIPLYGPIHIGGVILPNEWYLEHHYTILDPDHLECIENWWMLKSDKTKEYDNLKTTWKIDYPNRTIIKLSEIKIE